ncbi:GTP-binding protein of the rab [Desmophyllum pertusum]|uniref:GTP-binding protein of the rab n=1 Tax=Desmophyllum pertusum TaxID=174260 RepID=A0A9X0CC53_9CNID|nr:GTP-binding protein of the rab [Desmophyllum pertusum]
MAGIAPIIAGHKSKSGIVARQGELSSFKVVLLGDNSVGKSWLMHRFVEGPINKVIGSTIGAALSAKKVPLDHDMELKLADAQSYADDNNLDLFMEVSARTDENVENLFLTVGYNLWMANISAAELSKKIHKDSKALVLAKRKLLRVPDTVTELTEVKILDLSHNNLTAIPKPLTNLTTLILSHNRLAQLPEIVVELINLIRLHVDSNQLYLLPTSIKQLKKLQVLDLSNNKLKILCIEDISSLKHLEELYVGGNPLTLGVIGSLMELLAKYPGRIIVDVAGEH